MLTKVADAGKGGPEAMRRLAFGYRRKGDPDKTFYWFQQLAGALPGNLDCLRWIARYNATAGTESFNCGAFAEAITHWEKVFEIWPDEAVAENLGLALLCDASTRLRTDWNRNFESASLQVDRAHQLAPSWDSRYLNALVMLARGDYQASYTEFAALDDGTQDRTAVKFFAVLARYLTGDDEATNQVDLLQPLPGLQGLNVLVGLLQIQTAARSSDFRLAVERLETWLKLPDCVRAVDSSRSEVNALAWLCMKQANLRIPKLNQLIEAMKSQNENFWKPALAAAHAAKIRKSGSQETDPSKLEECDRRFQSALDSLPAPDRGALLPEYAAFLGYRIEKAVGVGDLVQASALLERLQAVAGADSRGTARLREVLNQRLSEPSHEKAYALIDRDPDTARATWLQRLQLHPGEHASLEHLACLAWTRAYDAVQKADEAAALAKDGAAEDYKAAVGHFVEGLGYYRQLYEDGSYWEALRNKGRLLDISGNPFDEAEFEKWKASALKDQAQTLLELAVHVAQHDKKGGVTQAKGALGALRNCGLSKEMVYALASNFADRFLDRDPGAISPDQFDAAIARAERVLQMDPSNVKALEFIVRGQTYRAELPTNEEPGVVAERIASAHEKAKQLEQQISALDDARRERVKRELAAFWETLGWKAKFNANEVLDALNASAKAGQGLPRNLRVEMRKSLNVSIDGFDQAERLDNTSALRTGEAQNNNHSLISQLDDIERNL